MGSGGFARIRVHETLDGATIDLGVPVVFRPVVVDPSGMRHRDVQRKLVNIIAPVTADPTVVRQVELDPGIYEVEAVLPSGERLWQQVEVSRDKSIEVVVRDEYSPNEWQSWAHFAGAIRPSLKRLTLTRSGRHDDEALKPDDFVVTLGRTARGAGAETSFDPASWEGWFNYLEARHERGPSDSAEQPFRLSRDPAGLEVERRGGDDGRPLRITLIQRSTDVPPFAERTYAAVSTRQSARVFGLPWPWGHAEPQKDGSATRRPLFDIMAVEADGRLRCVPILLDERWASLLAYMNNGRPGAAARLVMQAQSELFGDVDKIDNPLAAAAGAYVWMSTGLDKGDERWPRWLERFAMRFSEMPDSAILQARWLLDRADTERMTDPHEILFQAVSRGIPYFTAGVIWLIEGLMRTSLGCDVCSDLLATVRGVARSMDLSQAFTSFTITKPETSREAASTYEYSSPFGSQEDEEEDEAKDVALAYDTLKMR